MNLTFTMKIILSDTIIKKNNSIINKNDPFLPPFERGIFLKSNFKKITKIIEFYLINLCLLKII